jgi:hypothetical protein
MNLSCIELPKAINAAKRKCVRDRIIDCWNFHLGEKCCFVGFTVMPDELPIELLVCLFAKQKMSGIGLTIPFVYL